MTLYSTLVGTPCSAKNLAQSLGVYSVNINIKDAATAWAPHSIACSICAGTPQPQLAMTGIFISLVILFNKEISYPYLVPFKSVELNNISPIPSSSNILQ